jgi:hypothetical protein
MLHIGFTGTRVGLTPAQLRGVKDAILDRIGGGFVAHHGDCVGADCEFHRLCRGSWPGPVRIIAHPGPPSGWSAGCEADEWRAPKLYMVRNRNIVDMQDADGPDSRLMIAAPLELEPQPRGGTWGTIKIARRALAAGRLRELVVVGRDGELLDHTRWP